MSKKVIIAHDDLDLKSLHAAATGWSLKTTDNGTEALRLIHRFRDAVVAVVIDLDLPDGEAIGILRQMRTANPGLPVVALTRSDRPAEVAEAVGAGATECALKPIVHEDLLRILQRVTTVEAAPRPEVPSAKPEKRDFFHVNREMRKVHESLQMLGPWDVPVVFLGETGVGKEVAARELHRLSTRANRPFIKINCAAVPSELLESELFGYEKGAFTGAMRSKPGKFELADGGTVLLDEIGDMHANLQAKLLQVLQDGEFDRLGARHSMRVDVRVLAATHRDLRRATEIGTFREDLFYRLNVACISLPPLRERRDEIIPLAERFLSKHAKEGAVSPEIPLPLRQALLEYPWPGNVRELENIIRKFLVFGQADALASELWQRTAERARTSGKMAPPKITPRSTQQLPLARNGSNGEGSVTISGGYNGLGNGALSRGADPGSVQLNNGDFRSNGFGHQEGLNGELHLNGNGNGNGNGHSHHYGHAAPSQEEHNGHSQNYPEDFATSAEASDLTHYGIGAAENNVEHSREPQPENGLSDVRNGDQVSTLAEVEQLSKEFERRTILAALHRSTWNRKKAAQMLQIDYKGLLYKMKKLEIGHNGTGE